MGKTAKQVEEEMYVDNLMQEAFEILNNSHDLNSARDKLTSIFNRIAAWKNDNSDDDKYYEAYQQVVLAMAQFDFSKRLPANSNVKSVENFFSISLNTLNDELENNLFSKKIVSQLLKELPLQNIVVIGTNALGKINYFHTDQESLFPDFKYFIHQNIDIFFEDMNIINDHIQKEGLEKGLRVQINFKYKGTALLKIATTSWLHKSEGLFYILDLTEHK